MKRFTLAFILIILSHAGRIVTAQPINDTFGRYARISNSPYRTHINIHYNELANGIAIDLFSIDNRNYAGYLTNYTTHYVDTTINMVVEKTKDREYSYRIKLDRMASTKAALHLLESRQDTLSQAVLKLPDDLAIADCYNDNFKFKIEDKFMSQEIFCPDARIDSNHYQSWKIFRDVVNPNLVFLRKTLRLCLDQYSRRSLLTFYS